MVFECQIRYRVYTGKLANLKPTDQFSLRPPFKVKDYELRQHISPAEIETVVALEVGHSCADNNGSIWNRIS